MLEDFKCKPGSYVEIIPLGLICTLQYNNNGILQKIIKGYDSVNHTDADVFDAETTIKLKESKMVPQRIPFTNGTTWVKGVFWTTKLFKSEGFLPDCVQDDMLADLKSHMADYKFYACDLHNDSYNFVGGAMITTRLSTFGFEPLQGHLVYDELEVLPLEQIMHEKKSQFSFPLVSGIIKYESMMDAQYVPCGFEQRIAVSTRNYLDEHGFLRTIVECEDRTVDVPYCDVVRYDVSPKMILILNGDDIIYSRKSSPFVSKVSRNINCTVCHQKISVPATGHTYCPDPHCPSRMYSTLKHFLSVLELPEMDFDTFVTHIRNKEITCLLDVLSLEEYAGISIDCTLSNLLFAAVPFEVCRSADFFQRFVNCLGSVEALDYYLDNPDKITSDLNLNKLYSKNLEEWLSDPVNHLMIQSLLRMPDQIRIKPINKKFEGSPIFRGKTICITGKFLRGTLEDIVAILQSYSAKVTVSFDNTVSCVLLGHFEEEDKSITDLAMSYNVPIYGEDDFFKSYGIDQDMQEQV